MIDDEFDIRPATDDARVDDLAREFVTLKPSWTNANADSERASKILIEVDGMGLSPWQRKQFTSYVQYHWMVAASEARQMGLFNTTDFTTSLSEKLSGVYLVQARMNDGTHRAPSVT